MKIMLANFTKMAGDTGGLAKVTCEFANAMIARGHEVSIVFCDERDVEFFYKIDDKVKTKDLRMQNGKRVQFPLCLKLKREIMRTLSKKRGRTVNNDFFEKCLLRELEITLTNFAPDIVISFQPAASKAILCDLKIDTPVITMSHGDPADYFKVYPDKEISALEKSSVCQVLLPSFEKKITERLPNCRVVTIGNAVFQNDQSADLSAIKERYKIVFVGRLTRNHKRPHLIIAAFSKILAHFPEWDMEIWGAKDRNEYYDELRYLIKKNKLEDRVFIKGISSDIPQVLQSSDLFVIPSAYEGFGLSLAEAMSAGLPAIGYSSCSAVNELIVDGENGFLCEDGIEDFANKMRHVMEDRELRVKMGIKAKQSMQKYAPENIWNQWESLIKELVNSRTQHIKVD